MIYNRNDIIIGRSLEKYGEFSYGEIRLFEQILRPGNIVIEVGSNIGSHTLPLARHVGFGGVVFAIEAQRIIFQTLCGNLALNSIPNVSARHVVAGSSMGKMSVPVPNFSKKNNFGGLQLSAPMPGETVPMITIDSLMVSHCELLKIDVEGMEEEVIKGAAMTIERYKPFLYFECDREEKKESLLRYVDSLDYQMCWHLPYLYNKNNFRGDPENVFGEVVSHNVLAVSRSSTAEISGLEKVVVP